MDLDLTNNILRQFDSGKFNGNIDNRNFLQRKMDSIGGTLGTIGSEIGSVFENNRTRGISERNLNDTKAGLDDIARKYGYSSYSGMSDDELANSPQAMWDEMSAITQNAVDKSRENTENYVNSGSVKNLRNTNQAKFTGQALNTYSTLFDILSMMGGIPNGAVINGIQGGIEGLADELENTNGNDNNGWGNVDWNSARNRAIAGGVAGMGSGLVNEKVGNLGFLKGNNKFSRQANNILNTAGRGAIAGAVGGGLGGGVGTALNGDWDNVVGATLSGAGQGALAGGAMGGAMGYANMKGNNYLADVENGVKNPTALSNTLQKINNLQKTGNTRDYASVYDNADSFGNRLHNAWDSGDSITRDVVEGVGNVGRELSERLPLGNSLKIVGGDDEINAIAKNVIDRDFGDVKYNSTREKMLADIADTLYNADLDKSHLKPEYRKLYDEYGDDFWNKVVSKAGEIDDARYANERPITTTEETYDRYLNGEGEVEDGGEINPNTQIAMEVAKRKEVIEKAKQVTNDIEGRIGQKMKEGETYTAFDEAKFDRFKFFHGEDGTEYTYDKVNGTITKTNPTTGDQEVVTKKPALQEPQEWSADMQEVETEYRQRGNEIDNAAEKVAEKIYETGESYVGSKDDALAYIMARMRETNDNEMLEQLADDYRYVKSLDTDKVKVTQNPMSATETVYEKVGGKTTTKPVGKRTAEKNAYKELATDYFDGDTPEERLLALFRDADAASPDDNLGGFQKILKLAEAGEFAISYEDKFNALKEIYGDNFKESTYKNKDGSWKVKNGNYYVDDVYNKKIAMALKDDYDAWKRGDLDLTKKADIPTDVEKMKVNDNTNEVLEQGEIINKPEEKGIVEVVKEEPATVEIAPQAEEITRIADNEVSPENAYKAQKDAIKADRLKRQASETLRQKLGTVDTPTARAYGEQALEQIELFNELGIRNPAEWEMVSNAITGRNGEFSKAFTKLVANAGEIDTVNGLGEADIKKMIVNAGLGDGESGEGKALFQEIENRLGSLRSRREGEVVDSNTGKFKNTDDALDVIDVIRDLEAQARHYRGQDGTSYSRENPERADKAIVLDRVADLLEDRIYEKIPDVSSVLTPEVETRLKNVLPGNNNWADYVDKVLMQVKDGKGVRAIQKPSLAISKYIEGSKRNAGTFGDRVGDAFGRSRGTVIGKALSAAWDSDPMLDVRAKIAEFRANRLNDRAQRLLNSAGNDGGDNGGVVNGNVMGGDNGGNNINQQPNFTTDDSYMDFLNIIGRGEGRDASNEAYNFNSDRNFNPNDNEYGFTYGNGENNTVFDSRGMNGGNNGGGNDVLDRISRAMDLALASGDGQSYVQLMGLYKDVAGVFGNGGGSAYGSLSKTDQGTVQDAQNSLSMLSQVEDMFNNAGGAQGRIGGWFANKGADLGLNSNLQAYNQYKESVGASLVKTLVNLGATEADAKRYINYLPNATDTAEEAKQKIDNLRRTISDRLNNLYQLNGLS